MKFAKTIKIKDYNLKQFVDLLEKFKDKYDSDTVALKVCKKEGTITIYVPDGVIIDNNNNTGEESWFYV